MVVDPDFFRLLDDSVTFSTLIVLLQFLSHAWTMWVVASLSSEQVIFLALTYFVYVVSFLILSLLVKLLHITIFLTKPFQHWGFFVHLFFQMPTFWSIYQHRYWKGFIQSHFNFILDVVGFHILLSLFIADAKSILVFMSVYVVYNIEQTHHMRCREAISQKLIWVCYFLPAAGLLPADGYCFARRHAVGWSVGLWVYGRVCLSGTSSDSVAP